MADLYVVLIVACRRNIEQVPAKCKDDILTDLKALAVDSNDNLV